MNEEQFLWLAVMLSAAGPLLGVAGSALSVIGSRTRAGIVGEAIAMTGLVFAIVGISCLAGFVAWATWPW